MRDWAQGELAAGHMTIAEIKREPAAAVPRSGVIRPSGNPRVAPVVKIWRLIPDPTRPSQRAFSAGSAPGAACSK